MYLTIWALAKDSGDLGIFRICGIINTPCCLKILVGLFLFRVSPYCAVHHWIGQFHAVSRKKVEGPGLCWQLARGWLCLHCYIVGAHEIPNLDWLLAMGRGPPWTVFTSVKPFWVCSENRPRFLSYLFSTFEVSLKVGAEKIKDLSTLWEHTRVVLGPLSIPWTEVKVHTPLGFLGPCLSFLCSFSPWDPAGSSGLRAELPPLAVLQFHSCMWF